MDRPAARPQALKAGGDQADIARGASIGSLADRSICLERGPELSRRSSASDDPIDGRNKEGSLLAPAPERLSM